MGYIYPKPNKIIEVEGEKYTVKKVLKRAVRQELVASLSDLKVIKSFLEYTVETRCGHHLVVFYLSGSPEMLSKKKVKK
jgi:hypothetical protein